MAVFLDTNVFLFAAGADPPLREAAQQVLQRVAASDTHFKDIVEVQYVPLAEAPLFKEEK